MLNPALEILRQTPAAAAVVITAWLFLEAQARSADLAREQAESQTAAVLEAMGQTTAALSANTRAMARVELVLDQLSLSLPPSERDR